MRETEVVRVHVELEHAIARAEGGRHELDRDAQLQPLLGIVDVEESA